MTRLKERPLAIKCLKRVDPVTHSLLLTEEGGKVALG